MAVVLLIFDIALLLSFAFPALSCTANTASGGGRGHDDPNTILVGGESNPIQERNYSDKVGIAPKHLEQLAPGLFDDFGSDPNGFDQPELFSCDFRRPEAGECCWGNVDSPEDQFEWLATKTAPGRKQFEQYFSAKYANRPINGYMLTAASSAGATEQARFVSCGISCTETDVHVSFRAWSTAAAQVQLCAQPMSGGALAHCVSVDRSVLPGPVTVSLPPGSKFRMVFVASNLVSSDGDVVLLDDINVDFVGCGSGGSNNGGESNPGPSSSSSSSSSSSADSAQRTSSTDPCQAVVCKEVPCSFLSSGLPSDSPLVGMDQVHFKQAIGHYHNPHTGIRDSDGVIPYSVLYLKPGESGALDSGPIVVNEDSVVVFDMQAATAGLQIMGCINDANNCPWDEPSDVAADHRGQWFFHRMFIPKGSTRLMFQFMNTGKNEGAVALSRVAWLQAESSNPTNVHLASANAC